MTVRLTLERASNTVELKSSCGWDDVATRCFGTTINVEFGAHGGGGGRASVNARALFAAVRSDLSAYVVEDKASGILHDLRRLLFAVPAPQRLFNFDALTEIFIRQAVPYQVCTRTPPIIFTPANLVTFSLP